VRKRILAKFCIFLVALSSCLCQEVNDKSVEIVKWKKRLKDYPFPKCAITLEKIFSFPKIKEGKEDLYLWDPISIIENRKKDIFISDKKAHCIYQFDPSGKYIRAIGREGQGQGELIRPIELMCIKDYLVVNDSGNRRIQFFDSNGNYVKSFKVFKTYSDMTANKDGLIFAAPIRLTPDDLLIDVLNEEGKLLYSFGKGLKFKVDWNQLNRVKLSTNSKGEILIAFWQFAIVRKYSAEGTMLAEYRIEHKKMKSLEKMNMNRISLRSKGDKSKSGYIVMNFALQAKEEGFYTLSFSGTPVEILEFNNEGKLVNDYWFAEYEYVPWDFFVRDEAGAKKIFVLHRGLHENEIDILIPKQEGGIK